MNPKFSETELRLLKQYLEVTNKIKIQETLLDKLLAALKEFTNKG